MPVKVSHAQLSDSPDAVWTSRLAGPESVPLPAGFEHNQAAVDYANSQPAAA